MVPELLILALDFHRSPLRYRHLTEASQPLPKAFDTLFTGFAAALSPQNIDSTAARLGKNPARIEEAARFFIRQALLAPGADHYRILGLSRGATPATVREHYHLLVRLFHPDRSRDETDLDASLTARINEAYNTLRDPSARRRYDKTLASLGRWSEADPRAFFRPTEPVMAEPGDAARRSLLYRKLMRWSAGALVGFAVVVVIFALLKVATRPVLRANPDADTGTEPKPSYLRREGRSQVIERRPGMVSVPAGPAVLSEQRAQEPVALDAEMHPPAAPSVVAPQPLPGALTREQIRNSILQGLVLPAMRPASSAPGGDTRAPDQARHEAAAQQPPPPLALLEPTVVKPAAAISREESSTRIPAVASSTPRPNKRENPLPSNAENVPLARSDGAPPAPSVEASQPPLVAEAASVKPGHRDEAAPSETPSQRAERADALIRRLRRAYEHGDLGGFVALFARNAETNEGRGVAFIRADYADLFARVPERRLHVRQLSWQPASVGTLTGRAQVRISIRENGSSGWRHLGGTVEFELTETKQGLKISKMLHALKPL